jgi:hypothetical protein
MSARRAAGQQMTRRIRKRKSFMVVVLPFNQQLLRRGGVIGSDGGVKSGDVP